VLENNANRTLKFMASAILPNSLAAGPRVRKLLDNPFGPIVALRRHIPRKASEAAVRARHVDLEKASVFDFRSFSQRHIILKGLVGVTAVVGLLGFEHVGHQGLSRAQRVTLVPVSKVISGEASARILYDLVASQEAQSVIKGWFILRQAPGMTTATSTLPPRSILPAFPGQRPVAAPQF
jgi:hypothetical protein